MGEFAYVIDDVRIGVTTYTGSNVVMGRCKADALVNMDDDRCRRAGPGQVECASVSDCHSVTAVAS